MRRLQLNLTIAAAIVSVLSVVIGFIPARSGACLGSYLAPWDMNGVEGPDGTVALSTICRANGFPVLFWVVVLIALALWVSVVVVWQLRAHRSERSGASDGSRKPPPYVPKPPPYVPSELEIAAHIERLNELHRAGALTADEFATAKARLLRRS